VSTQECCVQARATLLRKQDGEGTNATVYIHVDKAMRPPVRPPGSSTGAPRERACWPAALAALRSSTTLPQLAPPVVRVPTTASARRASTALPAAPLASSNIQLLSCLHCLSAAPAPSARLQVNSSLRPQGPGRLHRLWPSRRSPRPDELRRTAAGVCVLPPAPLLPEPQALRAQPQRRAAGRQDARPQHQVPAGAVRGRRAEPAD